MHQMLHLPTGHHTYYICFTAGLENIRKSYGKWIVNLNSVRVSVDSASSDDCTKLQRELAYKIKEISINNDSLGLMSTLVAICRYCNHTCGKHREK